MAKRCDCHRNLRAAMAAGDDFWTAYEKHHKDGYHEHRCECPCGCSHDTCGYALCPSCSFDKNCGALRRQPGNGARAHVQR